MYGPNGIGKSNLLESLLITSIGRSNRTNKLKESIQIGEKKFFIKVSYKKEGLSETISVNFDGTSKEILHNQTKHQNFHNLLGIIPSVLYSPSDVNIITGDPSYRRRFIDIHLAQCDPTYITCLSRYSKSLRHRNALLKTNDRSSLDIWEHQLVLSGRIIQKKRENFILSLEKIFEEEFSYFQHKTKIPQIIYKPSPKNMITEESYYNNREKDLILGYTSIGPHRDDLFFSLDQEKAKTYSSEGEKRLLIISLKLTSYRMMNSIIFAMDDYYSYLDKKNRVYYWKEFQHSLKYF